MGRQRRNQISHLGHLHRLTDAAERSLCTARTRPEFTLQCRPYQRNAYLSIGCSTTPGDQLVRLYAGRPACEPRRGGPVDVFVRGTAWRKALALGLIGVGRA